MKAECGSIMVSMSRVLLVDFYDSYTWNLVALIRSATGEQPLVQSADALDLGQAPQASHVILGPGPGHPANPADIGRTRALLEVVRAPVLGVCLGHQILVTQAGGVVQPAEPAHGRVSSLQHNGLGLFQGLPLELEVVRYHSLTAVDPGHLQVTATALDDGQVMAVQHPDRPWVGVQFHPESIRSSGGLTLIRNFLRLGAQSE